MEYQNNSHCKFLIALHLMLVVKYRKNLLQGDVGEFVKCAVLSMLGGLNNKQPGCHGKCFRVSVTNFGMRILFGLMDILSVQLEMHQQKPSENIFNSKVSLSIHPSDIAKL